MLSNRDELHSVVQIVIPSIMLKNGFTLIIIWMMGSSIQGCGAGSKNEKNSNSSDPTESSLTPVSTSGPRILDVGLKELQSANQLAESRRESVIVSPGHELSGSISFGEGVKDVAGDDGVVEHTDELNVADGNKTGDKPDDEGPDNSIGGNGNDIAQEEEKISQSLTNVNELIGGQDKSTDETYPAFEDSVAENSDPVVSLSESDADETENNETREADDDKESSVANIESPSMAKGDKTNEPEKKKKEGGWSRILRPLGLGLALASALFQMAPRDPSAHLRGSLRAISRPYSSDAVFKGIRINYGPHLSHVDNLKGPLKWQNYVFPGGEAYGYYDFNGQKSPSSGIAQFNQIARKARSIHEARDRAGFPDSRVSKGNVSENILNSSERVMFDTNLYEDYLKNGGVPVNEGFTVFNQRFEPIRATPKDAFMYKSGKTLGKDLIMTERKSDNLGESVRLYHSNSQHNALRKGWRKISDGLRYFVAKGVVPEVSKGEGADRFFPCASDRLRDCKANGEEGFCCTLQDMMGTWIAFSKIASLDNALYTIFGPAEK